MSQTKREFALKSYFFRAKLLKYSFHNKFDKVDFLISSSEKFTTQKSDKFSIDKMFLTLKIELCSVCFVFG